MCGKFEEKVLVHDVWKTLIILLTFFVGALAFCCLAMGLLLIMQVQAFSEQLNANEFYVAPSILVVVAVVAIVTCVLACVGTHRRNKILIICFICLACLVMVGAITATVLLIIAKNNPERSFPEKHRRMGPDDTDLVHFQMDNSCCGYISPSDYVNDTGHPREDLPYTCCEGRENCTVSSSDIYQKTCREALIDSVTKYEKVAFILCGLISIMCCLMMVCGIVALIILIRMKKRGQDITPTHVSRFGQEKKASKQSKNKKSLRGARNQRRTR